MAYSNNSDDSGCGCLVLIVIAIAFLVNKCNDSGSSSSLSTTTTRTTYQTESSNSLSQSRNNSYNYPIEDELSEEDKKYEYHSLSTGTAPYSAFYGRNYKCPYSQCSGINVTAPSQADIVVIIKKDNSDGKVVSHGYIRAGESFQFDVPDGTYQTFFYYGKGWNPNKDMGNGVKGGFVKDEIFSKDNPQAIYSAVLSYVLQLQRNGNFQTKSSNRGEVF